MEKPELVPAALKAWMSFSAIRKLYICAAPHNTALNRTLSAFAEYDSLGADGHAHCLNFPNTIRSWMALKNSVTPLSEGVLRLSIDGETIEIKVSGGSVSAERMDVPADLSLTAEEAHYLLFGFNRFYAPEVSGVPSDWFPLPLHIPRVDTF